MPAVLISASATLDGAVALQQGIARLRALGERPRPIFDAIGAYGESSTRLRFKKGIDPEGKPWKPSLRAQATGGQTLVMQGAHGGLLGSITHRADDNSAEWGTNKVYAAIHQFGGVIKPKRKKSLRFRLANGAFVTTKRVVMPQRAFLGVNEEDGQEIQAVTLDVVKAAEAGHVGGA